MKLTFRHIILLATGLLVALASQSCKWDYDYDNGCGHEVTYHYVDGYGDTTESVVVHGYCPERKHQERLKAAEKRWEERMEYDRQLDSAVQARLATSPYRVVYKETYENSGHNSSAENGENTGRVHEKTEMEIAIEEGIRQIMTGEYGGYNEW